MPPRKLSAADKNAIVELYRQPGETTGTVAEQYDVSVSTISRLLKSELSPAEYDVLVKQKRSGGREAKQSTEDIRGTVRSRRTIKKGTITTQAKTVKKGATTVKKSKLTSVPEASSPVETEERVEEFGTMAESPSLPPVRRRRRTRAASSEHSLQLELVEASEIAAVEDEGTESVNDSPPVIVAVQSVDRTTGKSVIKPVVQLKPKSVPPAAPQTVTAVVPEIAEIADQTTQGTIAAAEDLEEELGQALEGNAIDELEGVDLELDEEDDELDEDELDEEEDDDELDEEEDEDELDEDELDEDEPVGKPRQRQRRRSKAARANADEPLEILPIAEADLARMLYLVIDRTADLITCPMQEFQDLGQVPLAEESLQTLPVFDNHRVARRFSKRNQRVIKVPDGRLLAKTAPWLEAKGITRCLLDGQVYSLETAP